MTQFKRFTNPEVLGAISVKHLGRFFDRFSVVLEGRNLPLPAAYCLPGTRPYYDSWITLLKSPEKLPDSLVEAILAIEELAAPENRPRLQAAVAQAPPELYLDPASLPECLALQLWLMAPYKMLHDTRVPLAHPMGKVLAARASLAAGERGGVSTESPGLSVTEAMAAGSEERLGVRAAVPDHQPTTPLLSTNGPPSSILNPQFSTPLPSTMNSSTSSDPGLQTRNSELPTLNFQSFHRHTGKIGRLPHEVRESINIMIYDGLRYDDIIEKLGDYGKGLKRYHLTRWKKSGYQEWLQEQKRKDLAHAKEEFALHILREKDAGKLHEASLQIASSHLGEFLADFDSTILREKLQADPLNFVRLLNALSKLSESGIKCEAHRVEMAERQINLEKGNIDPADRSITPETLHKIEQILSLH